MELPKFVLHWYRAKKKDLLIFLTVHGILLPTNIATKLRAIADNNIDGKVINVFMITASGAEVYHSKMFVLFIY